MSKISRREEWHTYVTSDSPISGGLTVYQLRDFVKALDKAHVTDSALVTAHHANDTRHLIRLSAHVGGGRDLPD